MNSFAWPVPGGATFGTARPDPSIGNLQVTDVVIAYFMHDVIEIFLTDITNAQMMYCDLSRFSKDTDPTTIFNKGYYVSTIDKSDRISEEDYAACGSKPSLKLMDAAITQAAGSGLRYPIIQFCPWYLNMVSQMFLVKSIYNTNKAMVFSQELKFKTRTHLSLLPKIVYSMLNLAESVRVSLTEYPVDKIALFCSTLLHEVSLNTGTPGLN